MARLPTWTTPPVRQPGWERSYIEVLNRHAVLPFGWGSSDCLILVADICAAITGRDPLPAKLRRYRTETGAGRLLLALGFTDIEMALAAVFPAIAPAQARRGDCAIIERQINGKPSLAAVIVTGPAAVGKGPNGQIIVPRRQLKAAFAIGSL